jgi:intracellular septation protein
MLDFDAWLTAKVWGVTAVSLIFAMSQLPLMLRHGLDIGQDTPRDDQPG